MDNIYSNKYISITQTLILKHTFRKPNNLELRATINQIILDRPILFLFKIELSVLRKYG